MLQQHEIENDMLGILKNLKEKQEALDLMMQPNNQFAYPSDAGGLSSTNHSVGYAQLHNPSAFQGPSAAHQTGLLSHSSSQSTIPMRHDHPAGSKSVKFMAQEGGMEGDPSNSVKSLEDLLLNEYVSKEKRALEMQVDNLKRANRALQERNAELMQENQELRMQVNTSSGHATIEMQNQVMRYKGLAKQEKLVRKQLEKRLQEKEQELMMSNKKAELEHLKYSRSQDQYETLRKAASGLTTRAGSAYGLVPGIEPPFNDHAGSEIYNLTSHLQNLIEANSDLTKQIAFMSGQGMNLNQLQSAYPQHKSGMETPTSIEQSLQSAFQISEKDQAEKDSLKNDIRNLKRMIEKQEEIERLLTGEVERLNMILAEQKLLIERWKPVAREAGIEIDKELEALAELKLSRLPLQEVYKKYHPRDLKNIPPPLALFGPLPNSCVEWGSPSDTATEPARGNYDRSDSVSIASSYIPYPLFSASEPPPIHKRLPHSSDLTTQGPSTLTKDEQTGSLVSSGPQVSRKHSQKQGNTDSRRSSYFGLTGLETQAGSGSIHDPVSPTSYSQTQQTQGQTITTNTSDFPHRRSHSQDWTRTATSSLEQDQSGLTLSDRLQSAVASLPDLSQGLRRRGRGESVSSALYSANNTGSRTTRTHTDEGQRTYAGRESETNTLSYSASSYGYDSRSQSTRQQLKGHKTHEYSGGSETQTGTLASTYAYDTGTRSTQSWTENGASRRDTLTENPSQSYDQEGSTRSSITKSRTTDQGASRRDTLTENLSQSYGQEGSTRSSITKSRTTDQRSHTVYGTSHTPFSTAESYSVSHRDYRPSTEQSKRASSSVYTPTVHEYEESLETFSPKGFYTDTQASRSRTDFSGRETQRSSSKSQPSKSRGTASQQLDSLIYSQSGSYIEGSQGYTTAGYTENTGTRTTSQNSQRTESLMEADRRTSRAFEKTQLASHSSHPVSFSLTRSTQNDSQSNGQESVQSSPLSGSLSSITESAEPSEVDGSLASFSAPFMHLKTRQDPDTSLQSYVSGSEASPSVSQHQTSQARSEHRRDSRYSDSFTGTHSESNHHSENTRARSSGRDTSRSERRPSSHTSSRRSSRGGTAIESDYSEGSSRHASSHRSSRR